MTSDLVEASSGRNTVMVAEDECILRMIAVEFLTDAGFIVIDVPHADAALAMLHLRNHEIHLLFTDINMPGSMSGLALAHLVRKSWPRIGIMLASGELRPKAHELPEGSRFLPKPYQHGHVVSHARCLLAA